MRNKKGDIMKTIEINSQDLGDAATVDTYGTFNGDFEINTMIDDYNDEYRVINGRDYDYDDFEWTFNKDQIVRDFAELRAGFLENESEAIQKVVTLRTGSPKFYNYSTDYAIYEVTYDDDLVEKYVEKNKEDYDKWYRDSGWYEHTEWMDDEDRRKEENIAISKLDYYLNKTIDSDTAYYALAEQEYEVYENNTTMKLKDNNKGEQNETF